MAEDIINIIALLSNIKTIISLSLVNKIFYEAIQKNISYQHHLLLLQRNTFETQKPCYLTLKIHLKKYLAEKTRYGSKDILYFSALCSKYNFGTLIKLILNKTKNSKNVTQIIIHIIKYAIELNIINILEKSLGNKIFGGVNIYVIRYSKSETILNKYITTTERSTRLICGTCNYIALSVLLRKGYSIHNIMAILFQNTPNKILWGKTKHESEFRALIIKECGDDKQLLKTFFKYKFMYACRYESIEYFKTNNLDISILLTNELTDAFSECLSNPNPLELIKWMTHNQGVILIDKEIIDFSISILETKNAELIAYWKNNYRQSIKQYSLHHTLSPNFIYGFYDIIEPHIIITQLSASCTNILTTTEITNDMINYLFDNIVPSNITDPIILLFFWHHNKNIFDKFIKCDITPINKIKILTKYLALLNTHTDDTETINMVCYSIINIGS